MRYDDYFAAPSQATKRVTSKLTGSNSTWDTKKSVASKAAVKEQVIKILIFLYHLVHTIYLDCTVCY